MDFAFAQVVVDTKLSLAFQVAEGGFLDIDVTASFQPAYMPPTRIHSSRLL